MKKLRRTHSESMIRYLRVMKMECPRCHNQNNHFLYQYKGQYYCRKCISFSRVVVDEERLTKRKKYPPKEISYDIAFNLSVVQKNISCELVKNYIRKENSYVWAVCGSGKTEIVFEVIQYALNQGHRVCFCIPRKELVKELYQRISQSFHGIEIGLLYGGCEQNKDSQFIICTMHQLYKFENDIGFDLMIADEVDAFPFYNDEVLQEVFQRCCLGSYIKLSATFSSSDIQNGKLLIMNKRYHGFNLPVPRLILCPLWIQKWLILVIVKYIKKRWIVYVPTIYQMTQMVKFLSKFHLNVYGVSSTNPHNSHNIKLFIERFPAILVSTTLLERGITIEDVQVIVYRSDHMIFDERTLIQIAGRVGRKPSHPKGYVYFLASHQSMEVQKCVKTIKKLNTMNV